MPRRSLEALLIPPLPTLSTPRIAPPAHLDKNELAIWAQITNALPANWFTRDQTALLERYCVHVARARNLESLIEQTDPISAAVQWDRLTRLAAAETRVMLGLARAMRLTPIRACMRRPLATMHERVLLADDLCVNDGAGILKQMVSVFQKYNCSIVAIEQVPPEHTNRYGIVAGNVLDDDCIAVQRMVEKPESADAPSNLAIIGRYVLTPDIFDILRQTAPGAGGEVQITDALNLQAVQGKVIAYRFRGKRFDCGSVDGFVKATNFFYRKRRAFS